MKRINNIDRAFMTLAVNTTEILGTFNSIKDIKALGSKSNLNHYKTMNSKGVATEAYLLELLEEYTPILYRNTKSNTAVYTAENIYIVRTWRGEIGDYTYTVLRIKAKDDK